MVIKSYFSTLIIFLFINFSFAQKNDKNNFFELKGEFSTINSIKKIYFSYLNNKDIRVKDSINVLDNKFTINGSINFPTQLFIRKNSKPEHKENMFVNVYIEPNEMKLMLNPDNFEILDCKGSKSQIEFTKINELKKNFFEVQESARLLNRSFYEQMQNSKDSVFIKQLQEARTKLIEIREKNDSNEFKINLKFASKNLKSFIVPNLLDFSLNTNHETKTFDLINSIYKKLDPSVINSPDGLKLERSLFNKKNSSLGGKAPNFILKDLNGKLVSLENLKGKCVLLDFWASWCAPCRADFPAVKELFVKNKEKDFVVVSMNCMDKIDSWKKTIFNEDLEPLINIFIEENKSETAKDYFVHEIPLKILIDKNGIIIGRWTGQSVSTIDEIQKNLVEILN